MDALPAEVISLLLSWKEPMECVRSALLQASTPAPLLHIHAPFSTHLVEAAVLSALHVKSGYPFPTAVYVDLRIHSSPTNIFDTILNGFARRYPDLNNGRVRNWSDRSSRYDVAENSEYVVWHEDEDLAVPSGLIVRANESLPPFVEALSSLYDSINAQRLFIVFGNAHVLATVSDNSDAAQFEGNFLAAVSRLAEISRRSIVPIFVSELPYHKFRPPMGRALEPGPSNSISFPPLSRTDVLAFVSHSFRGSDTLRNTFTPFINLVYDTFVSHLISNDPISQLVQLSSGKLWTQWQTLLATNSIAATAVAIRPAMTAELDRIGSPIHIAFTNTNQDSKLKLSQLASYLLMATYLASHNPARTDVRMFAVFEELNTPSPRKKGTKGTSSSPRKSKRTTSTKHLAGPKAAPLERVIAILHCIWDDMPHTIASSADVLSELATLVSLRLVIRTSKGGIEPAFEHLQNIKVKVNVEWEQIKRVAEAVRFAVGDRVWDAEV